MSATWTVGRSAVHVAFGSRTRTLVCAITLRSVAVEFLSDDQVAAYGRFAGPPERAELERFFFLDDADRALIAKRRGDHNRLAFGLQLGTVRFLGTFLADPLDIPDGVVDYLAGQLGVGDASTMSRYAERQSTQWEHAAEIRQAYGYRRRARYASLLCRTRNVTAIRAPASATKIPVSMP